MYWDSPLAGKSYIAAMPCAAARATSLEEEVSTVVRLTNMKRSKTGT